MRKLEEAHYFSKKVVELEELWEGINIGWWERKIIN